MAVSFPLFAPMKLKLIKHVGVRNEWRRVAVALTLLLLVPFGLTPAAAQKHITSVFTTTTAEGSRVTLSADAPINDYEAYRQGDRFYVKIPLAGLPSARGSLLGRGFDDVKIQRYGDGVIFSFRLQPGTTAYVDQKANHLDVIFSTPGRSRDAEVAHRTTTGRMEDSSGPVSRSAASVNPQGGAAGNRYARESSNARHPRGNPPKVGNASRGESTQNKKSTATRGTGRVRSTTTTTAQPVSSGSPSSSATTPSSTPTPQSASASSSASPVAKATPSVPSASSASPYSSLTSSPAPTAPQPFSVASATPPIASPVSQATDWASRIRYYKLWAELNWLPLLIGGAVVLCLLVLLWSWRRAKRKGVVVVKVTPGKQEAPKPPVPAATASEAQTKSSLISSPAIDQEHRGNDQEREVFEL